MCIFAISTHVCVVIVLLLITMRLIIILHEVIRTVKALHGVFLHEVFIYVMGPCTLGPYY